MFLKNVVKLQYMCCVQTSSVASSNTIALKCADHLKGGVRHATLSRDGTQLLVCGYDAFVYCYKWRHVSDKLHFTKLSKVE